MLGAINIYFLIAFLLYAYTDIVKYVLARKKYKWQLLLQEEEIEIRYNKSVHLYDLDAVGITKRRKDKEVTTSKKINEKLEGQPLTGEEKPAKDLEHKQFVNKVIRRDDVDFFLRWALGANSLRAAFDFAIPIFLGATAIFMIQGRMF